MPDWGRLGRRYARLATNAAVRRPALWPLVRAPLRFQFERLAPGWNARLVPGRHGALEAALAGVAPPPRHALDVGTGTGAAAVSIARRWPGVQVVGVDLAEAMVAEARRLLPRELQGRVRFERADAAQVPYADASFDLVALANAIPFFDELARVTADEGVVVLAFSSGPATPIYVPSRTLRQRLGPIGFGAFADVEGGAGSALIARRLSREAG